VAVVVLTHTAETDLREVLVVAARLQPDRAGVERLDKEMRAALQIRDQTMGLVEAVERQQLAGLLLELDPVGMVVQVKHHQLLAHQLHTQAVAAVPLIQVQEG
jgi:hypothetical protein